MRKGRMSTWKTFVVLAIACATTVSTGTDAAASTPIRVTHALTNTAPTSDFSSSGYAWVSYFRQLAGDAGVVRNSSLEAGAKAHVTYLANRSLVCETNVHDELLRPANGCPANPYATAAGKAAANNSDITRISARATPRTAVSNWFVSAFHALVLLDPKLQSTGYASFYTPSPLSASPLAWPFTAAVDVYRGRTGRYYGSTIVFPATGAVSPLTTYRVGTESPEPFRTTSASSPCHSWGSLGSVSAPLIVQWPIAARPNMSGTIRDVTTGRDLPTCSLTPNSYPSGSLSRAFLAGANGYTKSAFYYSRTPFIPGHRYVLTVGGQRMSDFRVSDSPAAPAASAESHIGAVAVNWKPAVTAGSGQVHAYVAQLFNNSSCGGRPARAAHLPPNTTLRAVFRYLAHRRRYFVRVDTANSLGALRAGACMPVLSR